MLEVTDDSGFLALVVPASYETFVASNWTFEQIMAHFKAQMGRGSLLIWGTGMEGFWHVDVVQQHTKTKGFREVMGPLQVVGASLLLTNYESLTMAAQFPDVALPEEHQRDLLVSIPDGNYSCRIIQMFDPDEHHSADNGKPDFLVELQAATGESAPWQDIPWFTVDRYGP